MLIWSLSDGLQQIQCNGNLGPIWDSVAAMTYIYKPANPNTARNGTEYNTLQDRTGHSYLLCIFIFRVAAVNCGINIT